MPKPRSITQVTPAPELEKRTRRDFTADYKLKIIAEADALCVNLIPYSTLLG